MAKPKLLITCPDCHGERVIWDSPTACRTCAACLRWDDGRAGDRPAGHGRQLVGHGQLELDACGVCHGSGHRHNDVEADCPPCHGTGLAGGRSVHRDLETRHAAGLARWRPHPLQESTPAVELPRHHLRRQA